MTVLEIPRKTIVGCHLSLFRKGVHFRWRDGMAGGRRVPAAVVSRGSCYPRGLGVGLGSVRCYQSPPVQSGELGVNVERSVFPTELNATALKHGRVPSSNEDTQIILVHGFWSWAADSRGEPSLLCVEN